jgi:hypothetical protein
MAWFGFTFGNLEYALVGQSAQDSSPSAALSMLLVKTWLTRCSEAKPKLVHRDGARERMGLQLLLTNEAALSHLFTRQRAGFWLKSGNCNSVV